jgi:hypothetical protein
MNFDSFLNPNVLGTAVGAGTIVVLLGSLFAELAKRFVKPQWALSAGFALVGILGTTIGAFTFSNGGSLAWQQAAATYGLPSFVVTLLSALSGATRKDASGSMSLGFMLLMVPAFVFASLLGARISLIEESYANRWYLDDPLAAGLKAISEEYPLIWSQVEPEIKRAEISGSRETAQLALGFLQTSLPQFMMLGSDDAVLEFEKMLNEKNRYLADQDPNACVSMASGTAPQGLAEMLSYDVKLAEAQALATLVKSQGDGNSGVADQAEAEQVFLSAFVELAKSDPKAFYAVAGASQPDAPAASATLACKGFIELNQFLLDRPASEYARYRRSELANTPNAAMSPELEQVIGRVFLYADAAELQETLPQTIDDVTVMTNAEFDGRKFVYSYAISTDIIDESAFRLRMNELIVPKVCADTEWLAIFQTGAVVVAAYTDRSGRTIEQEIDGRVCANFARD